MDKADQDGSSVWSSSTTSRTIEDRDPGRRGLRPRRVSGGGIHPLGLDEGGHLGEQDGALGGSVEVAAVGLGRADAQR